MFKVSYQLEINSDPSEVEPLGNIIISGEGGSIIIENTYIDAWFISIIEQVKIMPQKKNVSIKVLEEPNFINVFLKGSVLVLKYAETNISGNHDQFLDSVTETANRFIEQMKKLGWNIGNEAIGHLSTLIRG